MNLNFGTLTCEDCGKNFSCRVGLSNRPEQLFSIACKKCGALSSIEIEKNGTYVLTGLKKTKDEPSYHIDLHLDFPVFEHETWTPISPFIMSTFLTNVSGMGEHAHNMDLLNKISVSIPKIKNTINFYVRGNYKLFARNVDSFLHEDATISSNIGAEIYLFKYLFELIEPLSSKEDINNSIDRFIKVISDLSISSNQELDIFLKESNDTDLTKTNISDSLKIYKEILEREVIFRPSLFIDFDGSYSTGLVPYRLSTKDFEYIQDIFKGISEVISRQLTIVAGINNIIKRNDHNKFREILSTKNKHLEPTSLSKYSDLDFGRKLEHIDSSWLPISKDIADNQLRNSTAHYKWDYDPISQVIKYYPKKEGLERKKSVKIFLIDYCKKVIDSFRVMHELNFLCHTVNLKINKKI